VKDHELRELVADHRRLLAFEQDVEVLMIPWLDVSDATRGMTPTERVLAAVQTCKSGHAKLRARIEQLERAIGADAAGRDAPPPEGKKKP